ncbi:hypothetical protein [Mucilaginibacter sp. L196]|uniref:hypothetical protein n=1 Tax=Mucilaginibacter sp. L196 TaxID=1641870 RepID=UPI00131B2A2D|nr:hypothetical protein [Mucilaginibacter sp. L196]
MEDIVFEVFMSALPVFFQREIQNITDNVSERNLCGRLLHYIERELEKTELSHYHVDNEYNRKQGGQVKTIINKEEVVVTITCDLLIHSRGEVVQHDNLLALEMKKSTARETEKQSDKRSLCALTAIPYERVWSFGGIVHPEHVCGYKVGIYMEINRQEHNCYYERYRHGELLYSWTENF